jgi:hypothetical protein
MSEQYERLREALAKIAEIAGAAVNGNNQQDDSYQPEAGGGNGAESDAPQGEQYGCGVKTLPTDRLINAALAAIEINPVNAPVFGPVVTSALAEVVSDPMFIAVTVSKYWGPTARRLSVSFMESTPADLRARIVSHLNAWNRTSGIQFVETQGVGDVRISRGPGGYWSYLGTDITQIPQSRQTMNLQGFTMNTSEGEFRRVVRHEAGHTLGFPHEHMRKELVARIDPAKAYDYFRRTQGWDRAMVDAQVLTSLDDRTILGTSTDQTSIMCYQLPATITRDGRPITGGLDINQTDYDFAGRIYPKPPAAVAPPPPPTSPLPKVPKPPKPPFQTAEYAQATALQGEWDFEY